MILPLLFFFFFCCCACDRQTGCSSKPKREVHSSRLSVLVPFCIQFDRVCFRDFRSGGRTSPFDSSSSAPTSTLTSSDYQGGSYLARPFTPPFQLPSIRPVIPHDGRFKKRSEELVPKSRRLERRPLLGAREHRQGLTRRRAPREKADRACFRRVYNFQQDHWYWVSSMSSLLCRTERLITVLAVG